MYRMRETRISHVMGSRGRSDYGLMASVYVRFTGVREPEPLFEGGAEGDSRLRLIADESIIRDRLCPMDVCASAQVAAIDCCED